MTALPEFTNPDHDESILWPRIRNLKPDEQETVRFMYSELEMMCGSRLEGHMLADICCAIRMLGGNCVEVRKFVKPQYPVGWCRLDFYVAPFRAHPQIGFAIECDGERWHDEKKDAKRDAWLMDQGIRSIYRFTGKQITDEWWASHAYTAIRKFLCHNNQFEYGKAFA
jgi:very-short-patch-repair endonuclease